MENKTIWTLDPAHSELIFKVKHLMITNVKGQFKSFDIEAASNGDDFTNANVKVTVKTNSVFTNDTNRDTHLRSADFFDSELFPEMIFESNEFNKLDEKHYSIKGNLTIKNISKPVVLEAEFGGTVTDPYGNYKAGFSISGKFNRKDWNLNWNAALEAGGVLVSDEVRLTAEIQLIKKA